MRRRPSLVLVGAALLSLGAPVVAPRPAAPALAQDAPPPPVDLWTARASDVARSSAAKLWKSVEEAKSAQLFEFAARESRRVLALDPDHKGARAVLGQSKGDGGWADDPALAAKSPRSNFPGKPTGLEEAAAVERKWVKDRASARTAAAAVWATFGDECTKKGDAAAAEKAHRRALDVDPDQPRSRAALGYFKWQGVWFTGEQVRAVEAACKAVLVDAAGPVDAAFGTKLFKVETPHFRIESGIPPERLQPIAKWLEIAYAVHMADLGKDPTAQIFPSPVRFVLCENGSQWNLWVEKFVARNREFYRTLEGCWAGSESLAWSYAMKPPADNDDETRRDHIVHRAVHAIDSFALGVFWPSWVDEGLSHLTTVRVQGMTRTWCVGPSKSEYAKLDQQGSGHAGWIDESEWRSVARATAAARDDLPLRALVLQKFSELGFPGTLKAWSLLDHWRADDPESFRALLPKLRGDPGPAMEKALEAHFGKGLEAIDDDWRRWVLRTY
jgi:hypothetical protein